MASSAELVRMARTRAGLTQAALAERLNTTQSAIARLERGGSEPSLARLDLIVHACGGRLAVQLDGVPRAGTPIVGAYQRRWDDAVRMANFVLRGRAAAMAAKGSA